LPRLWREQKRRNKNKKGTTVPALLLSLTPPSRDR